MGAAERAILRGGVPLAVRFVADSVRLAIGIRWPSDVNHREISGQSEGNRRVRGDTRVRKGGPRADHEGMAKVKMSGVLSAPVGKVGDLVFVRLPGGGVSMRDRSAPANPRTAAQHAWRHAMAQATRLYKTLDEDEYSAWAAFVERQHRASPLASLSPAPRVYNVFVALTAKFIALNPGVEPPRIPPTTAFLGDGVVVSAMGLSGGVRFTGSGPNSSGVATELLLQPLASPGRRGDPGKYRIAGVHAFASVGDPVEVPCRRGPALAAVRFVSLESGQSSALIPLGRVTVG